MNIAEGSALLAAFLTSILFLLAVPPGTVKEPPRRPAPPEPAREKPLIGEPPGWQR